jgi:hypothetical protein
MTRVVIGTSILLATFAALPAQPPKAQLPKPPFPAWDELEKRAAALRPAPDEVRWQRLPWVVEPNEAIALAKAEHRPIFFWAAGGRGRDGLPLERC